MLGGVYAPRVQGEVGTHLQINFMINFECASKQQAFPITTTMRLKIRIICAANVELRAVIYRRNHCQTRSNTRARFTACLVHCLLECVALWPVDWCGRVNIASALVRTY